MRETAQETELVHQFLRGAYPESQGWSLQRNTKIGGKKVAFALRAEDRSILVPPVTTEPYVSKHQIEQASQIREQFELENQGCNVQVLLFYKRLVMPPGRLPKDILVFSIDEESPEERRKQNVLN